MTRKHNVQIPGETKPKNDDSQAGGAGSTDNTNAAGATGHDAGAAFGASANDQGGNAGDAAGSAPGADAEEVAQLRARVDELESEFDLLRENFDQLARFVKDRLGGSTKAADASALSTGAKHQHHTREHYAKMRAHEVDPTTITAPVLTLDGHVVPVPKDAK